MNKTMNITVMNKNNEQVEVTKQVIAGFVSRTQENNGFVSIDIGIETYKDGETTTEYVNHITCGKNASDKFKQFVLGIPKGSKVVIIASVVDAIGKDDKPYVNRYIDEIDVLYRFNKKTDAAQ